MSIYLSMVHLLCKWLVKYMVLHQAYMDSTYIPKEISETVSKLSF